MAGNITIELRQVSAVTSEASIRDHRVLVDRPLAKGGTDAGAMGGELFLASVGGCFMSNLLAAIKARDANVANVRVEVTGSIADAPARFATVDLRVTADSKDRDLFEKLVEIADRGCIMMNTVRSIVELRIDATSPISTEP